METREKNQLAPCALTENEAARYIGMSVPFLRQSRMDGPREGRTSGPPYMKIGRSVRYLLEDLDNWLLEHRIDRQLMSEREGRS